MSEYELRWCRDRMRFISLGLMKVFWVIRSVLVKGPAEKDPARKGPLRNNRASAHACVSCAVARAVSLICLPDRDAT